MHHGRLKNSSRWAGSTSPMSTGSGSSTVSAQSIALKSAVDRAESRGSLSHTSAGSPALTYPRNSCRTFDACSRRRRKTSHLCLCPNLCFRSRTRPVMRSSPVRSSSMPRRLRTVSIHTRRTSIIDGNFSYAKTVVNGWVPCLSSRGSVPRRPANVPLAAARRAGLKFLTPVRLPANASILSPDNVEFRVLVPGTVLSIARTRVHQASCLSSRARTLVLQLLRRLGRKRMYIGVSRRLSTHRAVAKGSLIALAQGSETSP